VTIKLQAFNVPNFALAQRKPGERQDGIQQLPAFPLRDIGAEELANMCDDFRREIFRKAGKKDPSWKE
jgi:hypothetical protein